MKTRFFRWGLGCLAALLATGWALAGEAKTPPNWHSGVGASSLADPAAAGDEAAAMAKAKLGGVSAKLVVVGAAEPQLTPELVAAVAGHFDADIVYGCQVTSPLTAHGNHPDVATIDVPVGVCVWALGGDMEVAPASVATNPDDDDSYYTAGEELGTALRAAVEASEKSGKIILTFGDQYNGANKDFAAGFNDGLGDTYPIIGAAAGNITAKVVVKGEIRTGVNVGIFLGDEFRLGQAMNGGTHTPETADKTLAAAVAEGGGADPFFAFIFNCRRRRQGMIERNQLAEELEAIKRNLPGVDFFGFYGPGEIGSTAFGEPAKGVGFTVVTAVFFAR